MTIDIMPTLKLMLSALIVAISNISEANADCASLNKAATNAGVYIPGDDAGRTVIGKGRLQFYSAPDLSCSIKGTFILRGESVDAYTEYGRFTSVVYLGSKSKFPIIGWVESRRLKVNDRGIAPHQ